MVTGGGLPMRVLSRECRKISYEALAETSRLRSYLKATFWVSGGQNMLWGQSVSGANCAWGQSMCEPFSKDPFSKVLYHIMPNY